MSQRERQKVSRLKDAFPEHFPIPQPEDEFILFVTLNPLYYLNVEKFKYFYTLRPLAKNLMKESVIKEKLSELTKNLQEKMGLNPKFKNIFTKDGKKVMTLYDLYQGGTTFFISSKDFFVGINEALKKHPVGMLKFLKEVFSLEIAWKT